MRRALVLCAAVFLQACSEDYADRPAASPPAPSVYVVESAPAAVAAAPEAAPAEDGDSRAAVAHVFITPDKHLDRPTEVVGVFDFHTRATSEDKGFDELRAKAAAIGADAVIGAEFEHGEGDEPSHLSGMAVRYR
jgi:hypothetical protein